MSTTSQSQADVSSLQQLYLADGTHPVQYSVTGILFVLNMIVLFALNRLKRNEPEESVSKAGDKAQLPWPTRQRQFAVLISSFFALAIGLDLLYPVGKFFVGVKAYVFGFPLGLLDLHFSRTRGFASPFKILLGAALWCVATTQLPTVIIDRCLGGDVRSVKVLRWEDVEVEDAWQWPLQVVAVVGRELVRYVLYLLGVGLAGDLLFSPLHRLQHAMPGWVYQRNHKVHHEYTNRLTALVLYHGALLDDFLMPLTAGLGLVLYTLGVHAVAFEVGPASAWQSEAVGAWGLYLIVFNTLVSHAHDTRCATLLAPGLPPSLNFAAYHYAHHLSPGCNFGLVRFSDLFWDWLLGASTIRDLHDFPPAKQA